jgi:hypothetical protein
MGTGEDRAGGVLLDVEDGNRRDYAQVEGRPGRARVSGAENADIGSH